MIEYEVLKELINEWTHIKEDSSSKIEYLDNKLGIILYELIKSQPNCIEDIAKRIDEKKYKFYLNKLNGIVRKLVNKGVIRIQAKLPMKENNKIVYRIVYEVVE